MPERDGYDVRFAREIRDKARAVGDTLQLPRDRGVESVDPKIRLAAALDDNAHLKERLTEERQKVDELRVMLRTALWELAAATGETVPQKFVSDWYRRRKAMP